MRTTSMAALALVASLSATAVFAREEFGTAKEAVAMVARAVAHIREAGPDKAYQDFSNRVPAFVDRDLYVVVDDLEGRILAHGQYPKLVGENVITLLDPTGRPWIKERIELSRNNKAFWHDYKFTDPITKKALSKSAYCERLESSVVCVGVYKR
jgi:cytochrome c